MLIRGQVLQNRTTVTQPTDPAERALTERALRIIDEYVLHTQGITYEQMGYRTHDGLLPAFKIDEHVCVKRHVDEAQRDKPKPKPRK